MIKDERPIVVGIGEALLDCFKNGTQELGGAPLIFAYHAAKSHCRGVIISAIGNDGNGSFLKEQVAKKGVTPVFNIVDDKHTGLVKVNNDDPNNPLYTIDKDSAWTEIQLSDKDLKKWAEKADAVYFGSLASHYGENTSRTTIENFLKAVPKKCYKIFDVNLRCDQNEYNEDMIRDYVKECNVLKANEEEIVYVGRIYGIGGNEIGEKGDKEDGDAIGKKLMEQCSNIKILILTKGKKGSTVFWKKKENEKGIFSQSIHISVEPNETIGAGDAMVGAFIGELLNRRTESEAHLIAALRADLVCKEGSMPKIIGTDFFFSYSKKDKEVVDMFYSKFIESKEYTVFKDTPDIKPGKKLGNVIGEAIENCQVLIYFSSENANKSRNVLWEIKKAIVKGKDIIVIKLDDSDYPKAVCQYLEPIKYLRFDWYKQTEYLKLSIRRNLDDNYKEIIDIYKSRPI